MFALSSQFTACFTEQHTPPVTHLQHRQTHTHTHLQLHWGSWLDFSGAECAPTPPFCFPLFYYEQPDSGISTVSLLVCFCDMLHSCPTVITQHSVKGS